VAEIRPQTRRKIIYWAPFAHLPSFKRTRRSSHLDLTHSVQREDFARINVSATVVSATINLTGDDSEKLARKACHAWNQNFRLVVALITYG